MAATNLFNQDPLSQIILGTEGVGSIRGGGGGSIIGGLAIGGTAAVIINETIKNASEEAKDKETDDVQDTSCPTGECNKGQEQKDKEKELRDRSRDSTSKHATDQTETRDLDGTWNDANKDFDELKLKDVKPTGNGGRYGKTEDGGHVNVRPTSDSHPGEPTLEFHRPDGGRIKFRYRPPGTSY